LLQVVASVTAFPDINAHNCARPFTSVLLAIDVRERWVVAEMVSNGVDGDDTLPGLIEPWHSGLPAQIGAGRNPRWNRSSRLRGSDLSE
jgi:hypothetical protein